MHITYHIIKYLKDYTAQHLKCLNLKINRTPSQNINRFSKIDNIVVDINALELINTRY